MTAAGKIAPAKVFIAGAGVAGLAAIGAAASLGAIVRANDTRAEVADQVVSLGGEFVKVEYEEEGSGGGGYAKVMSEGFQAAQRAMYARQAREVDIIVTTALIPGKPAPRLITAEMVQSMKPGSVIVDMAAEQGGNCELTVPGEAVVRHGVTIVGYTDLVSRLASQSSTLYSNNLLRLTEELCKAKDGMLNVNMDDEAIRGLTVIKDGVITWPAPPLKAAIPAAPKPAAATPVKKPAHGHGAGAEPMSARSLLVVSAVGAALFWLIGAYAPAAFLGHFTVFVLACFIGYMVVWNVTPSLHTPLMSVTNAISSIIAVGALAITDGKLSVGGLIACSIISGRALAPMAQIASMIVQWAQASAALKGLEAIMALPSDQMPGDRPIIPETTSGELGIEKVRFTYHASVPSVLEVGALRIAPGERVAILGNVGSGKSTLVKVLSGLYRPQGGRVFLGGLDMTQIAPEFVREQVGYLAQDVRLFQGTLRDNITIGLPNPSDEQVLGAARLTGLLAAIEAHPKGLNLEIAEGGRGLSGGQRQLVGLTRMLIAQPRVLLLDEPTASMDAALENFVTDRLFQALPAETTIVVVTHKTALLKHVTRLIVMERGRVVLDGPRDQVLARIAAGGAASQQGAA
jgi:NAD/NADP transhydrogenase alpha subunit/energy-coupling factor transporter ATP-binding protein EcfA2